MNAFVPPNPATLCSVLQGMKLHHAWLGLALLPLPLFAQTSLTTYYMVPPTSGCNGLWAFGPVSAIWQAPCSAPYLYVVEPFGCAEGAGIGQPFWTSGDTAYSNLCSVPCGITIYDSSGECVILCQLPVWTDVPENGAQADEPFRIQPNPVASGESVRLFASGARPDEVTLLDMQGRVADRLRFGSEAGTWSTSPLRAGAYVLQARWPDGRTSAQRLVVR